MGILRWRRVAVAAAGVLLAGLGACADRPQPRRPASRLPFFFIQISDPQYGFYTNNNNCILERELFARAAAHINRLRPAFVIVTGDIINKEGSDRQADEILRDARAIDPAIPLHWVPGNHDVGGTPTALELAWFRKRFGPDHYSFETGECLFLVLNSPLATHSGDRPDEAAVQDAWLADRLREASSSRSYRHIMVFMHHPLFVATIGEWGEYPREVGERWLRLFERHGVRAAFAGHRHRNFLVRSGGFEMVTTSSLGKPFGDDPSGFRIVKVYADRIEHQYYGLDAVPAAVALDAAPAEAAAPASARATTASTDSSR